MNEKIKSCFNLFLACVSGAVAMFIGIVFRRRNCSSNKAMAEAENELGSIEAKLNEAGRTQSERIGIDDERKRVTAERAGIESERKRVTAERAGIESERKRIDGANADIIAECESIIAEVEKRNSSR